MQIMEKNDVKQLVKVLTRLDDEGEMSAFLSDLLTIRELLDMSQRLEAAVMLSKGESYQTISKEVGASTATISRVSKCLNYGEGGYVAALRKLEK